MTTYLSKDINKLQEQLKSMGFCAEALVLLETAVKDGLSFMVAIELHHQLIMSSYGEFEANGNDIS